MQFPQINEINFETPSQSLGADYSHEKNLTDLFDMSHLEISKVITPNDLVREMKASVKISDPQSRVSSLERISKLFISINCPRKAIKAICEIPDPNLRAKNLMKITETFRKQRKYDLANEAYSKIDSSRSQNLLVANHYFNKHLQAAALISDPTEQGEKLRETVKKLLNKNKVKEAIHASGICLSPDYRNLILSDISNHELIENGEPQKAFKIAKDMPKSLTRDKILSRIATHMDNRVSASKVASYISDPQICDETVKIIIDFPRLHCRGYLDDMDMG